MASDMAQNATIFKVTLEIADIDRAYYHDHALTIARHPSETDERMMVRLLAFARHADEALAFGRGLGTDDEPDLWRKDLTGAIDVWIDVGAAGRDGSGEPAAAPRRSSSTATEGVAPGSGGTSAGARLDRVANLTVVNLPFAATQALAKLAPAEHATALHDAGRPDLGGGLGAKRGDRARGPEGPPAAG